MLRAGSVVCQCFQKVNSFVNDNLVNFSLIVFEIEIVLRKLLDGEVGSADGTFFGKNICGFSDSIGKDVIGVWLVGLHGIVY
jgi:hypothetical protein